MKKFLTWTFILTKRTLKNPILIVLLAVIPAASFIFNKIPSFHTDISYCGGIYIEGDDELSRSLCNELIAKEGIFTFVEYDDLDEMYYDIKTNRISCGYIFPDDLSDKYNLTESRDCITIIKQPGSTMQISINEFVFAQLVRLQNYDIITDYIVSSGLFKETDTDAIDELIEYYEYYTDSDVTFRVLMKTYGVSGLAGQDSTPASITFPVRGILAIMVFLAGMFGSVLYMSDREKGIFETLNTKYRLFCRILYVIIPAVLFACSALATLAFSGLFVNALRELAGIILLIVLTLVFCQIMIWVTQKSSVYAAAIPGILLCCLIFCPVFIQVSSYIPAAKFIEKLFIPYYYLILF